MIVLVVVGVLAALALPIMAPQLCAARLYDAQGHLLQIASKMRIHKIEQGTYYGQGTGSLVENDLRTNLGVDLSTSGNFCFVTICPHDTLCSPKSTQGPIASAEGVETIEFEVWAILRNGETPIVGPDGVTCTVATNKAPASGWVKPADSGDRCRQGQAVVLRYPPPPNGLDTTTTESGIKLDWLEGTSISHTMQP